MTKTKVAGKGLQYKFAYCTDLCWAFLGPLPIPPPERLPLCVSNRVPIPISTIIGLAKCLQKKVICIVLSK